MRGSRSPLLAYPEKLALCRWGIRDGLYIIAMFGFHCRSTQPTKEFGVNILRGSRSLLLAYLEKLALCRWGIRDGLDIIAMFVLIVGNPNGQRDLGLIF